MNVVLAAVGTLALTASLVACGDTSSRPAVDPDVAGKPTWGGCQSMSSGSIDYAADARGEPTIARALAAYRKPGDHVVKRPRKPHRNAAWLLVDSRNVIHTSVEMHRGHHGWLVNLVEKCTD
jgi:hypothetical protein